MKTTEPTWYYVRPNQHVLDVGQTEDVLVVLVEVECKYVSQRSAIIRIHIASVLTPYPFLSLVQSVLRAARWKHQGDRRPQIPGAEQAR